MLGGNGQEEILKSKIIPVCVLSFIIECPCCLTLAPIQFPQSGEKSGRTDFFRGQEKVRKIIFLVRDIWEFKRVWGKSQGILFLA